MEKDKVIKKVSDARLVGKNRKGSPRIMWNDKREIAGNWRIEME